MEQSQERQEERIEDLEEAKLTAPTPKENELPRFGESKATQNLTGQPKSYRYLKGLFGRVIVACFLFLLLFLGRLFTVNVAGQTTDSVMKEVRNNKFVESLEQKLSDVFQKTDQDTKNDKTE